MTPIFYFILEISQKKKILGVGCKFLVSKITLVRKCSYSGLHTLSLFHFLLWMLFVSPHFVVVVAVNIYEKTTLKISRRYL